MKKRLAIISTHPIQYNAPQFALLARSENLLSKVFYTWGQSQEKLFDKDFGKTIEWDIPLLEGYDFEFVENVSKNPGLTGFNGIVCPGLVQKIESWGAEAILVYGWNFHAHYRAMRHFKGRIPVWFRGDSTLLDETGGIKQIVRRIILRFIYRNIDFAFYVGQNNRAYYLKHGLKPKQLFFAPHAIDNRRFGDPTGAMRREAKQRRVELGINENETVILFAGKFEPKKNPILLLEAALALQKPGIHYLFTGNGVLEERLREMASGNPNIHFLPFQNQSQIPVVYHMCDILALPSQGPGETWGLVVNEAMACGKAILVSDKAGCAIDLVKPGINGYILPSGDLRQCMQMIDTMTQSTGVCHAMGEASARMIVPWSFEEICRSYEMNVVANLNP